MISDSILMFENLFFFLIYFMAIFRFQVFFIVFFSAPKSQLRNSCRRSKSAGAINSKTKIVKSIRSDFQTETQPKTFSAKTNSIRVRKRVRTETERTRFYTVRTTGVIANGKKKKKEDREKRPK